VAVSIDEFAKALASLQEAMAFADQNINNSVAFKIARDACIQRFEFSVELAWKSSVKMLGLASVAPKPAIRDMAQSGLIANPTLWFEFVDARNRSSHTYAEHVAKEVFSVARSFVPEAQNLLTELKRK